MIRVNATMAFPMTFAVLSAVLWIVAAQEKPDYVEVGQRLVLEVTPQDMSTIQKPIQIIRWKFNDELVVDRFHPHPVKYYGRFKNRTHLDVSSLALAIEPVSSADGGKFHLETGKGPVRTFDVRVIKAPPTPEIILKLLECDENRCAMQCSVDTQDLGPVTYQWRPHGGVWTDGEELKNMTRFHRRFFCRLRTRLRFSPDSLPVDNPRFEGAQEEPDYVEVGQRLVLEVTPQDLSDIPTPIQIIRWIFNEDLVVDWFHPNPKKYYGRFKARTHLDVSSLALAIEPVSSADGGKFHLETGEGPVRTFDVRVIKAPPTPEIILKLLECDENRCAMQCSVDTQDLGPVTYQWRPHGGVWTDGEELKNMTRFHRRFFCRLRTRLRFSPDSLPVDNPRFEGAQEEPDYVEVGQRLVLEVTPQDLSDIPTPIQIIRWIFNEDLVVDWFHPNPKKYYGRFKARTHLDVSSLALAIEPVSSADGGKFHLETGEGPVRTFDVRVIKAPPTPEIILKLLECDENRCAMQCSVDTQDLGPVTYQWRPHGGVWTDGEELKNMTRFHRRFFCRLRTRLRFSPDSLPVDNPRFEGAQEEPDYVEVGQRLVLEVTPQDLSDIPTPIQIIRWIFNEDLVVDWFHPNPKKYYGRFKARTHLDVSSLALAIEPVSSADGGKFHLETGEGPVRTFDVRVIKAPPTPEIILKLLECDENRCAMQCSVDTQDLGPVTYQWRPHGGVWTDGEELKNMTRFHRRFFCRLRTRLRFSPDSLPVDNPRFEGAQEEPDYVEVGQRLVLEVTPQDLSDIPTPIQIIRWIFNEDLVVDWFHPNPKKYYGRFKARTHLDVSSLALAIEPVSSDDGGKFHLETGEGPVRTFDVRVIKAPPTPEIILKLLECDENRCAMQCSVDTQDLGPVTYQWRPHGGVWTDGEELKNMTRFHRRFFCRLRTRLRFSPDSLPVDNPRFEGAQEEPDYVEVGQRLVLEVTPQDLSTIQKPIQIIRWKFNDELVVDRFHPHPVKYYGRFKNRTHLDVSSLALAIEPVSSADGGKFHLETGKGPVRTFDVRVIKAPPTPKIILKPLVCVENRCAMTCSADTKDLGPVTYQWRTDEDWTDDEELKKMDTADRSFICRLRTHLSVSPDSARVANPLFVEIIPDREPNGLTVEAPAEGQSHVEM
ncbi:hypothetical protein NHX12_015337 [Muraenolepis orangiensis]|uniref:Immunoglobulin domain-containing protein n=1 Tax=Muraenolepis orangiensis TaxID=630683 RepID=A0A9Q0DAU9_9TELE|nr:hypothetical protein NHX12_015337 [Muraenolepis orangiensis]